MENVQLLHLQAEEQLKLVEEQRKVLEERQAREKLERQKQDQEQAIILNKKDKKRPKLSFSLGPKWQCSQAACWGCLELVVQRACK